MGVRPAKEEATGDPLNRDREPGTLTWKADLNQSDLELGWYQKRMP